MTEHDIEIGAEPILPPCCGVETASHTHVSRRRMLGFMGGAAAGAVAATTIAPATPAFAAAPGIIDPYGDTGKGRWDGPRRPRFHFEDFPLNLPPGKAAGQIVSVTRSPVDDSLFFLNYPGPPADTQPIESARLNWIIHVDKRGNFINTFGGDDSLPQINGISQWPSTGIENVECDAEGNVWMTGWTGDDDAILKYSPAGQFIKQFGARGAGGNDSSTTGFGSPPSVYHDIAKKEVIVADGYGNHRVVIVDHDTGQFKRFWGSYGEVPATQTSARRYGNPVHKVTVAPDGKLLVCDRPKNRIQEFDISNPNSVAYLREVTVVPGGGGFGTCSDVIVSPDNMWMYVVDMTHGRIWILNRATFEIVSWVNAIPETEGWSDFDPNLYTSVAKFSPITRRPLHRFTMLANGDLVLARTRLGLSVLRFDGVR